MKIGVLALQGAFEEHAKTLNRLGVEAPEIRKPEQLDDIDGLIIPGGESTTIGKLLDEYGFIEKLRDKGKKGLPIFGTCAGMILLSKNIEDGYPGQPLLGLLDITSRRNAYGRQVDSFEAGIDVPEISKNPFPGVFIRAPQIVNIGKDVKVIGKLNDEITAIRQGNIIASSFHPELTGDTRFHEYFLNIAQQRKKEG